MPVAAQLVSTTWFNIMNALIFQLWQQKRYKWNTNLSFPDCGWPLLETSAALDFTESNLSPGCCTTGTGAGLSSIVFSYRHLLASVSLLSVLIFCRHLKLSSLRIPKSKIRHKTRSRVQFFKTCKKGKSVGICPLSRWGEDGLQTLFKLFFYFLYIRTYMFSIPTIKYVCTRWVYIQMYTVFVGLACKGETGLLGSWFLKYSLLLIELKKWGVWQ
jgi:hypothetical protein